MMTKLNGGRVTLVLLEGAEGAKPTKTVLFYSSGTYEKSRMNPLYPLLFHNPEAFCLFLFQFLVKNNQLERAWLYHISES